MLLIHRVVHTSDFVHSAPTLIPIFVSPPSLEDAPPRRRDGERGAGGRGAGAWGDGLQNVHFRLFNFTVINISQVFFSLKMKRVLEEVVFTDLILAFNGF